jgi:TatD DNase family protein
MFDTHCHLDMPRFDDDRDAVIERARAAGITAMLIPGVDPARWHLTEALALPGKRYIALGIHPQVVPDLADAEIDAGLASLESRLRASHAAAVGECGLDGLVDLALAPMARQIRILHAHIEIARALDLPLSLHVLRAHDDALRALRDVRLPRNPGVIHSYSGSAELARQYLSLGFHLSFAGAVTRPNARRPVESARVTPLERLLVETDAPDQTPTGASPSGPDGRRCEPAHLGLTVARLAAIHGIEPDELAKITTVNARKLFEPRGSSTA